MAVFGYSNRGLAILALQMVTERSRWLPPRAL
jgi:hypothetical protein